MANIHTLNEFVVQNDAVSGLAMMQNASNGRGNGQRCLNDVDMADVSPAEPETITPDEDAVNHEDMKTQIAQIRADYEHMDKTQFNMDDETREWLEQKDQNIVVHSAKSRMDRNIGIQMKKIDEDKNDRICRLRLKMMECRTLMKKLEPHIEAITRDADAQKGVLRRRRIHMKAHPI